MTEKGSLLSDLIALIELTPVRSPGFQKESAVMSPLIRPDWQEEKEGQEGGLQEKGMYFFCWSSSSCRRHRGSGHYAGSLCPLFFSFLSQSY